MEIEQAARQRRLRLTDDCLSDENARLLIKNRVLLGEKHRAVRQITEARFVFGENHIRLLAFRSAQRGNQIIGAIPPNFSDAVIRGLGAARLLGRRVERVIQRVALDIAFGFQRFGIAADQWPVVFEPVFAESFHGHLGITADTIYEFEHKNFSFSLPKQN